MQFNIPINMLPNGSYVPVQNGVGVALVTVNQELGQNKTALINFAGSNQAVVNFNSENQPINFTLFNANPTTALEQSVNHIVNHMVANGFV